MTYKITDKTNLNDIVKSILLTKDIYIYIYILIYLKYMNICFFVIG